MYRILIVDDEKWVRSALRLTIEKTDLPFRVTKECEDVDDALSWMQSNAVDLILTDIRMPGMDGLTFIREVQRQGIRQDFVVISMYEDFQLVQEALRLGVFDYLLKPVQISDIEMCFKKWMSARPANLTSPHLEGKRNSKNAVISQVLQFIENTPLDEVSLVKAAEYVHLSPNYLSAIFKRHLSMNFVEYLTRFRVNEVKRLLDKTDMTVADIAERIGYSDLPYFSNFFKREVGCTPSDYRNKCKTIIATGTVAEL